MWLKLPSVGKYNQYKVFNCILEVICLITFYLLGILQLNFISYSRTEGTYTWGDGEGTQCYQNWVLSSILDLDTVLVCPLAFFLFPFIYHWGLSIRKPCNSPPLSIRTIAYVVAAFRVCLPIIGIISCLLNALVSSCCQEMMQKWLLTYLNTGIYKMPMNSYDSRRRVLSEF